MQAIGIIHDEHRSLAGVLHGMLYLVRDIRLSGKQPKFEVLGAMVYYIHAFPERFHHPKEDAYLFRFLALRYPDAAPLIDQLKTEHRTGARRSECSSRRWSDTAVEARQSFQRSPMPFRLTRPSTGITCAPKRTS